jgi:fructan beta-(2,6)-fructosidase
LWAEKKTEKHNWRLGVLGQYYNVDGYHQDRSFLFHSVEKQPRILRKSSTTDPFFNYNI